MGDIPIFQTNHRMGSTEETTKSSSVKKKMEMEEESDSTSKPTSGAASPDPLEHGIDDDLKPLTGAEAKSSESDTESEIDTASKQSEGKTESGGIPVQGARCRVNSESSSENDKSSSSEHSKR